MKFFEKLSFIIISGICLVAVGCIKTNTLPGTSSLTIVNAIPNSNAIVTNFLGNNGSKTTDSFQYYNSALQIYYGSYSEVSSYTGATHISLSQTSDTLLPIANMTLNMQIGGIYSLFLAGSDTTQVDTLFSKDNIPYYPASGDSATGVRFVNLSKGSTPISITLQSDTNHSAILSNIAYKNISSFQSFSANSISQSNGYIFEFRDATNTILATYPINIYLNKSQTLALYGNSNVGYSVMSINNY
jgi:hypothetical protein